MHDSDTFGNVTTFSFCGHKIAPQKGNPKEGFVCMSPKVVLHHDASGPRERARPCFPVSMHYKVSDGQTWAQMSLSRSLPGLDHLEGCLMVYTTPKVV
jgi:hypothetical protein